MRAPLAKIEVVINGSCIELIMAVVEGLTSEVLIGEDVVQMDELLEKEKKLRELEQESKSVCITRAQDKEHVEQGIRDGEDEKRDGACPLDIFSLNESIFSEDSGEADVQTVQDAVGVNIPVPDMGATMSDLQELMAEQLADETLTDIQRQADAKLGGYEWRDGLLVHSEVSELGEDATRIVVPKGRRSDVLRMAHSSLLGGHFSICKTRGVSQPVLLSA